ncbi:MAG: hypothetical protein KZQ94_10290 [Candidatus Thiodiazotropha sp. (ex Troendleina suluensis)]|nr:hypothetical protein [Candidatus Thiodiazotropha sp. (ex Troendleina suluensis)]
MTNNDIINAARIEVLKNVIGALIVTHPDPGKLADMLSDMTNYTDKTRMFQRVAPNVREHMRDYAEELIELARDQARQTPPATTPGQ